MGAEQDAARRHVLEFAASAMSRGDSAAARAWCEIAWLMSRDSSTDAE